MFFQLKISFLLRFSLSCALLGNSASALSSTKPPLRIVASTPQISEAVGMIGGSEVEVKTLVAPGTDPHTYVATASDVEALKKADLIFYSGLHLEAQMERVLKELSKSKPVVAISQALPPQDLLPDPDIKGNFDPHFWHDVALWRRAVTSITNTLLAARAESKAQILSQAEKYDQAMQKLDTEITKSLAQIPETSRVLVTIHDAFQYFAKRYGFKVENIQGMNTESEASVADIKRVSDFLAKNRIPALFLESTTPTRSALSVIEVTQKKGVKVAIAGKLYADGPEAAGHPAGTYEGMVRTNVSTMVQALARSSQ
jgi:manganese/zinc/iron transport system substrate-binding protein